MIHISALRWMPPTNAAPFVDTGTFLRQYRSEQSN